MKQIIIITLALIFINTLGFTNAPQTGEYSVIHIPKALMENANAVIRDYKSTFTVHSKSTATEKVFQAVTILNKGTDLNGIQVFYNKFSKVKSFTATLYNEHGKVIRKIKKNEIDDYSATSGSTLHSDSRFKNLDIAYNSYPYTIAYSYEVQHTGLLFYPQWDILQETSVSMQKGTFTVLTKPSIGLRYKAKNIEIEPKETTSRNEYKLTWAVDNLKARKRGAFSPRYSEVMPYIKVAPNQFAIAGYNGKMDSWKNLGYFFYQLNEERDKIPEPLIATVKELTKDATTDEEKIAILYEYLQRNTRYISIQLGIGGWQTFESSFVAEKKYGDCKALTYFMKGMLSEVGITAYPALVYAGTKPRKVDEGFPAPQFNHVILHVPLENNPIWLECTSNYQPINYLSDFTENRKVLLIKPEGGELVTTPQKDYASHRQIVKAKVNLLGKGAAEANVKTRHYEGEHDALRQLYHEGKEEEKEKLLRRWLDISSFEIKNMELEVSNNEPHADWNFDIALPKYFKQSGKRIFLTVNLMNRISSIPSASDMPQHSIERILGYTHIDTIEYQLPKGYVIENIPADNFELATDFGKYQIQVIQNGEKLTYIRKLEMYAFSLPKERYDELRDFYSKIVKKDKMKIVLVISA